MQKIAIIGAPGAGKTTLAKALGSMLGLKVYHLDRLFWHSGWRAIDREKRIDILQKVVMEKQWIIEGTYLSSSEARLKEADTIIFLDTHPLVCLWRVIQRHREYQELFRRDIPEQCTDRLRLLKALAFPLSSRRRLLQMLFTDESKQIVWLCSDNEVKDFLSQRMQAVGVKSKSSRIALVAGEGVSLSIR